MASAIASALSGKPNPFRGLRDEFVISAAFPTFRPVPVPLPAVDLALQALREVGADFGGSALYSDVRAWLKDAVEDGRILPHETRLYRRLIMAASSARVDHHEQKRANKS